MPPTIESGNFSFDVLTNHDSVLVNLDYPLTINSKDGLVELSSFSHEMKVPLGLFYSTIGPIVDISIEKNAIPTEKIKNLTEDFGLNFSIVIIEEEDRAENMLYMVGPMDNPIRAAFVIQYDWFGDGKNG